VIFDKTYPNMSRYIIRNVLWCFFSL